MSLDALIPLLDYASVLVFALTGALVASRGQLDVVGFIFFATLTGIGGGTLRDLVLGRAPVFWVGRPELLLLTAGAAIVVF
ncbi:TRIC cation channel family protein, partial [Paracoccus sp. PXZ]